MRGCELDNDQDREQSPGLQNVARNISNRARRQHRSFANMICEMTAIKCQEAQIPKNTRSGILGKGEVKESGGSVGTECVGWQTLASGLGSTPANCSAGNVRITR